MLHKVFIFSFYLMSFEIVNFLIFLKIVLDKVFMGYIVEKSFVFTSSEIRYDDSRFGSVKLWRDVGVSIPNH